MKGNKGNDSLINKEMSVSIINFGIVALTTTVRHFSLYKIFKPQFYVAPN